MNGIKKMKIRDSSQSEVQVPSLAVVRDKPSGKVAKRKQPVRPPVLAGVGHERTIINQEGKTVNVYEAYKQGINLDWLTESKEKSRELDFRTLLIEGERILDMLEMGVLRYGMLDDRRRNLINLYFYITNPLINRIVTIHTNLPLASMTLQKPKLGDNEILQDYVYRFFEKMLNRIGNWKKVIYEAVINYWVFARGLILVEDDFPIEKKVEVDEDDVEKLWVDISDDDQETIRDINMQYSKEGMAGVTKDQIQFVLSKSIKEVNKNYNGIKRMRVVSPFEIWEERINDEIGYNVFVMEKSFYIKDFIKNNLTGVMGKDREDILKDMVTKLHDVGYTYDFIELTLNEPNSDKYEVSNDPYESGVRIAELQKSKMCGNNVSILSPVTQDALKYWLAEKKQLEKLKLCNKKINLVSASDDVGESQLLALQDKLKEAADNFDGSILAVNYQVTVEEVVLDTGDKLGDTESIRDDAKNNIANGTGTPDSILSAQDTYGGSFLKLEVLNQEYLAFRQDIAAFIENTIFKPISIRKGFITHDKFGHPQVIVPRVNFEVGSIIGTSDFKELLKDLVNDEVLPKSKFLEYIGFDPEEIYQEKQREKKLEAGGEGEEGGEGGGEEGGPAGPRGLMK